MLFEDQKDIFFDILQLWLDQGRIKFCKPSDPLGEVWHVPGTTIIEFCGPIGHRRSGSSRRKFEHVFLRNACNIVGRCGRKIAWVIKDNV